MILCGNIFVVLSESPSVVVASKQLKPPDPSERWIVLVLMDYYYIYNNNNNNKYYYYKCWSQSIYTRCQCAKMQGSTI